MIMDFTEDIQPKTRFLIHQYLPTLIATKVIKL